MMSTCDWILHMVFIQRLVVVKLNEAFRVFQKDYLKKKLIEKRELFFLFIHKVDKAYNANKNLLVICGGIDFSTKIHFILFIWQSQSELLIYTYCTWLALRWHGNDRGRSTIYLQLSHESADWSVPQDYLIVEPRVARHSCCRFFTVVCTFVFICVLVSKHVWPVCVDCILLYTRSRVICFLCV